MKRIHYRAWILVFSLLAVFACGRNDAVEGSDADARASCSCKKNRPSVSVHFVHSVH